MNMDYEYHWSKEAMQREETERERFDKEYMGIPVTVSDGLKLEEMHKRNKKLQDQINKQAIAMLKLETENINLQRISDSISEENLMIRKENKKLTIEVEKIHSRYDILDM